jgi:O-antigen ligase
VLIAGLAVAVPAFAAFVLWTARDLERFVLIVVLPALIIPQAIIRPGGLQVALGDMLLLVAVALWFALASVGRVPRLQTSGNPLLVPALLFVAVNTNSLIWSIEPHLTAKFTVRLLDLTVLYPLVFASMPQSLSVIRRGMYSYIGFAAILGVITAANYLRHAAAGDLSGQSLALGLDKNTIGAMVGAGVVMAYGLWTAEPHWRRTKLLLSLGALTNAVGLTSTVSRASIIGVIAAIIAVSLLQRRHRVITILLVAIAITVYLATIGPSSHEQNGIHGSYDSSSVRTALWHDAYHLIERRPFLGTGGATFSVFLPQFGIYATDPDNMFLLTWCELGVVGVLALCLLLSRYGRVVIRCRNLPGEAGVLAMTAAGVSISFLVHFQFDVTWTRGTTALAFAMMGVTLAVERLAGAQATVEPANLAPAPAVPGALAPVRVRTA